MHRLSILIAASAMAILPAFGSASAEAADSLSIFRAVCLANAPAFGEAAIQQAAKKVIFAAGDVTGGAGVQWKPGRKCTIAARTGSTAVAAPTVAEVDPLVAETLTRLGGGKFTMKRIKKNTMQYRMVTPAGRFEISASFDAVFQRFNISKL